MAGTVYIKVRGEYNNIIIKKFKCKDSTRAQQLFKREKRATDYRFVDKHGDIPRSWLNHQEPRIKETIPVTLEGFEALMKSRGMTW
jgi:hypothetical protein